MIRNKSWLNTKARHEARDKLREPGDIKAISNAVQEFQSVVLAARELDKDDSILFLTENDFQPLATGNRVLSPAKDAFVGKGRLTEPLPGIPNTPQWFLFESKPYASSNLQQKETVKRNVRTLAQKLHRAQEHRDILRLIGFTDENDDGKGAFQLIFARSFQDAYPNSLESYLRTNTTIPSLNFRVNLCNQLATAVLQTMTLALVHKNIRPENILLLPTEPTADTTGAHTPGVSLTGWQYARVVERGVTNFRGETTFQRKVYQHPQRQLVEAEKAYSMAHDVYSLGVCMIEILTWKSLLLATEPPTMSEDFITAFKSLNLDEDPLEPYTKDADQIKQTLVAMCAWKIPVVAGEKMALLIKDFLTCLDDEKENEDEAQYQTPTNDEARRQKAIRFVDTVLKTLRDIQTAI